MVKIKVEKRNISKLLIIILIMLNQSCQSKQPLETVKEVDIQKYLGVWYEIAAFPQVYEKGCFCVKAEYSLHGNNKLKVVNSCRKDGINGLVKMANGKASVVKGSNNSKLKVWFFWPFKGDYWIIDLASDYSYAVVGNPKRTTLWILNRTPQMDKIVYDKIVERAKNKGFDVSKLRFMEQQCY